MANAVAGTATLFFIQIFCTLGFAVLYSSLVLYATKHLHFPVKDAAVIMGVVDSLDRLLLARNGSWPEGRVSVLAGFVEPGESFESAVRREVHEEVGVRVGEVEYLGSQPWPFPASVMVGFLAHVEGDGKRSIAQLVEITNQDPRRGVGHEKVLTRIKVDEAAIALLKKQGFALEDVPEEGTRVLLAETGNMSTGGS